MGDVEGQRDDVERQKVDAESSRAMMRLARLTQSLGDAPKGFSWGKLAEYLSPRTGINVM